jgi:hypothetical protein
MIALDTRVWFWRINSGQARLSANALSFIETAERVGDSSVYTNNRPESVHSKRSRFSRRNVRMEFDHA